MASPPHFQVVEGVEPAEVNGRSSWDGFYNHWFLVGETRVERGHNPWRSDWVRPAQMTANPTIGCVTVTCKKCTRIMRTQKRTHKFRH